MSNHLVLLDTCSYLRLARRIRPVLGITFGQKNYFPMIHSAVENEVLRSTRLKERFPWFSDAEFVDERCAKSIRLSAEDKTEIEIIESFLKGSVEEDVDLYTKGGRSPPGATDRWLLALAKHKNATVVTDDMGMHQLAEMFDIPVWHGFELLDKLRSAKVVNRELILEIYAALEANQDLPKSWADAKSTTFPKIFGQRSPPDD